MYLSHAIGLGKCTNSNNLSHATSPNKIAPLPTRHNGNRKTNHLVSSQITRLTIQEPVTLLLQMNMIENGDVDLMMYLFEPTQFLVACYVTLHLLCQSVGVSFHPSVRWSVHWSHISFLFVFFFCGFWPVLLPKWSADLNYGPCPPAQNWGSCGSGLVCFCNMLTDLDVMGGWLNGHRIGWTDGLTDRCTDRKDKQTFAKG